MKKQPYSPSIIQTRMGECYICACRSGKLDRHEVFGAAYRQKSKALGLWVELCHDKCHLNGVHAHGELATALKEIGQKRAMETYGWTKEEFINEFGRNYLC